MLAVIIDVITIFHTLLESLNFNLYKTEIPKYHKVSEIRQSLSLRIYESIGVWLEACITDAKAKQSANSKASEDAFLEIRVQFIWFY